MSFCLGVLYREIIAACMSHQHRRGAVAARREGAADALSCIESNNL